jgi:hypothetical protein
MKRLALLGAVLLAGSAAAEAQPAGGRLFYEIVVTNPGSRSQGWHGTLYGQDGRPAEVPAGQTMATGVGDFVSVACEELWVPCGMIHVDTLAWMAAAGGNVVMDASRWEYRLYVTSEGTRSEGWHGELVHGADLAEASPELATPMGTFVWLDYPFPWGWHGWFHRAWLPAK